MTSLADKIRENTGFTGDNRQQIIKDAADSIIEKCEKHLLSMTEKDRYKTIMFIDRDKYMKQVMIVELCYVQRLVCEHFKGEGLSILYQKCADERERYGGQYITVRKHKLTFNWYPKPMSLTKGTSTLAS